MTSNAIVQKLWNYCNILRDDGLSYQDYIEQLTFLLFLKMADERQNTDRLPRTYVAFVSWRQPRPTINRRDSGCKASFRTLD
jgi:type I restriction-modification system DNA methylase subunit